MAEINFFSEETDFTLPGKKAIRHWLWEIFNEHNSVPAMVNFIFTSDSALLEINKQYLQHDYYTDVVTFQYSGDGKPVEADLYISVDRVRENATSHGASFTEELHRVMAHGILHTLGFRDTTDHEKSAMRKLENHYLALRQFTVN